MEQVIVTRGEKKTSVAKCYCKRGNNFEIRVNKVPIDVSLDSFLIFKYEEVTKLIPEEILEGLEFDIVHNNAKNHVASITAGVQAYARAVLAYVTKNYDEEKKRELKDIMVKFNRFIVVTDTRKKEAKKYGGPSARARYQKSYR